MSSCAFLLACSIEVNEPDDGSGGSGASAGSSGTAGTGAGATDSEAGSGGSSTGETPGDAGSGGGGPGGEACETTGTQILTLTVSGLPSGVDASVTIEGPDGAQTFTGSETLESAPAGEYTVRAEIVTDDDPFVRRAFAPTVSPLTFCHGAEEATVEVDYALIPSSNKLWATNASGETGGDLLGFSSAILEESGEVSASVLAKSGAGKDLAFDREGNLWAMGATLAEPQVIRFAASSLGTSGEIDYDRSLDIAGLGCIPALRAMAFDAQGALWVSVCGGKVMALSPSALDTGGEVTPDLVISEITNNAGLAFDAEGNLWVTADGKLTRYDRARLDESTAEGPDRSLTLRDAEDSRSLDAEALAFDAEGDLWVLDSGGNYVFEIAAADLEGSGEETVISRVSVALAVSALPERPAWDESGGLWLAYGAGKLARFDRDQLGTSTGPGEPTVPSIILTSEDIGYADRVALFPAPRGLPLYHSLP